MQIKKNTNVEIVTFGPKEVRAFLVRSSSQSSLGTLELLTYSGLELLSNKHRPLTVSHNMEFLHSYIRRHKSPHISVFEIQVYLSIISILDGITTSNSTSHCSVKKMTKGRGVCLIAGAGPGIGQAVARRFAKEGFTIVAVRRNKDQLQALTADIANSGKRS